MRTHTSLASPACARKSGRHQAATQHSDPSLTANVYTDPKLLDVAGAVASLPDLPLREVARPAAAVPGS